MTEGSCGLPVHFTYSVVQPTFYADPSSCQLCAGDRVMAQTTQAVPSYSLKSPGARKTHPPKSDNPEGLRLGEGRGWGSCRNIEAGA